MELKHIHRDDSPEGVWINSRDFNPNLHRIWVAPKTELPIIQTVEIAGLQEPIEVPKPPAKTRKKVKTNGMDSIQ